MRYLVGCCQLYRVVRRRQVLAGRYSARGHRAGLNASLRGQHAAGVRAVGRAVVERTTPRRWREASQSACAARIVSENHVGTSSGIADSLLLSQALQYAPGDRACRPAHHHPDLRHNALRYARLAAHAPTPHLPVHRIDPRAAHVRHRPEHARPRPPRPAHPRLHVALAPGAALSGADRRAGALCLLVPQGSLAPRRDDRCAQRNHRDAFGARPDRRRHDLEPADHGHHRRL